MIRLYKILFISFLLVCLTTSRSEGQSLNTLLKRGDAYAELFAYAKAVEYYEKAATYTPNDKALQLKLAECYRKLNNVKKATYWCEQALLPGEGSAEQILAFSQLLQQMQQYQKAHIGFETYYKLHPKERRAFWLRSSVDSVKTWNESSSNYIINSLSLNDSVYSDIGPMYTESGLVFSSDRITKKTSKRYTWTNASFYSLYETNSLGNQSFSTPKVIWGTNNRFHEAVTTCNPSGTVMYFTKGSSYKRRPLPDEDKIVRLQIMSRKKLPSGEWSKPIPFAFNNEEYSYGHPALTPDASALYFVSDCPGGYGGVDIYVCYWENDHWGKPINLGPEVNSEGDEMFPFIASDGTLFFASNGHAGLGGLDIYSARKILNQWTFVKNLGGGINSSFDDFGYVTQFGSNGYFCSNRDGSDDIFSFSKVAINLTVIVYDKRSGYPLSNANVTVFEDDKPITRLKSDAKGEVKSILGIDKNYTFKADRPGFEPNEIKFSSIGLLAEPAPVRIPLNKITKFDLRGVVYNAGRKMPINNVRVLLEDQTSGRKEEILTDPRGSYHFDLEPEHDYVVKAATEKCGELTRDTTTRGLIGSATLIMNLPLYCTGDTIKIENIYYDLDRWSIRPDAAIELDKLFAILIAYPTMKIELRSHTDSRAPDDYNMTLSQRRATSAVNYLISKGIEVSRLIGKGYGETLLVNRCADAIPCTEAEHQANRRTEFIILNL
ncbi:MAG: OmpA family protein [Chitinophagales bacterium]|jgi:outer membrane protein OmpA-like peptidoglycan-associated protein/tetratricopeptide (TPR) repeat protein|nr:OmpA family protein [Chitinophagales bacterium]